MNKAMTIIEKIERIQDIADFTLTQTEVDYLHDIKDAFVQLQQKVIKDLVDYKRLSEVCTDNIKDNVRLAEALEIIATDISLSHADIMRLAGKTLKGANDDE